MSIATEIGRIQAGRNIIRSKLAELGMARSDDNLDTLAAAVEGIENQGAVSESIDGLTVMSVSIPAGYTSGGTVSLSGDIEAALAVI